MKDYDTLLKVIKLIQSQVIRDFVTDFLDTKVPEYFKTIPASSSGKYHPCTSLGEGGLVRHTIAAVKIGFYIVNLQHLNLTQEEKDYVIAALILHDTFKQGYGKGEGYTTQDHEIIASNEIEKEGFKQLADLVKTHMGQWGKFSKIETQLQFYVHLADYLASRKQIVVDCSPTV